MTMKTVTATKDDWNERLGCSPLVAEGLDLLRRGDTVLFGNVVGALAPLLVSFLRPAEPSPWLVILPTLGEAQGFADDLALVAPDLEPRFFPASDEAGFTDVASGSVFGRRLDLAERLRSGEPGLLVVTTVGACLEPLPASDGSSSSRLALRVGESLDREELIDRLEAAGFRRSPLVERPGEYAVRGGVLDLYDHRGSHPLRVELFGDEVESLRRFDVVSQRSLRELREEDVSLVTPGGLADLGPSLASDLPNTVRIVARDPDRIRVQGEHRVERLHGEGGSMVAAVLAELEARYTLVFHRLPQGEGGLDLDVGEVVADGSDLPSAAQTLLRLSDKGRNVALHFTNDAERERFFEALEDEVSPETWEDLKTRAIASCIGLVSRGFVWREEGIVWVNHRELFDIPVQPRRRRSTQAPTQRPIDDFVDLKPGDYVVHIAQGVGMFRGMETVEKGGEFQEFLVVEFRDEVLLYVPVAKADLVQKYVGGKGEAPRLSKLGGSGWSKRKDDVLRAVTDLAADMLETQALRASEEGWAHPPDSPWQHEFEAAFPFEETPDQLVAMEAIKQDMEAPRPMDRILCGDVGYGKTELAMRAAFKTVMAGRQAAMLVPTTVLAEQHALTFLERMADYPVKVAALSRFQSRGDQQKTLVGLLEGSVDIVIGTHRLLSKDVGFKNLGLLIIDEEQRFGVAHKETLKSLRRQVDVLTMTATPIPRTLHLAMLGLRDISSLTQAPRGRQPIATRIVPFERGLVRDAILREMGQGGQCFFVHNRVQSIQKVRKEIESIVPEAHVLVLHGQMKEADIEKNLMAFVRGEADVLLATTIIESGIDIPNANTIFIDRPELYGLADLHQLRGRVGRERTQAHAYLLLRAEEILTSDAEKRIRAIEEFDELGAGFRIAMRDLEIRGAGNILGHQQHGHIAAVGYDLYCRLLDVAVKRLRSERAYLPDEVDLNLPFEAYLPDAYVPEPSLKLELYRKMSRARTEEEFLALGAELRDRFGPIPREAEDLLDVCKIRALAEELSIGRVFASEGMGLKLRPRRLKPFLRRLTATGAPFRVIDGKDVLLPRKEALESPTAALRVLRAALVVPPSAGPRDLG